MSDPENWTRKDWAELQADLDELDELEATDPEVAASSKRLDEVTAQITGRERPSGGLIPGTSANDDSIPTFMLPGYGYGTASNLTATATDDGITIEMQCGATILAVHLSPDEWDDFRAEGDDARDAFEAGALEDGDEYRDLEQQR